MPSPSSPPPLLVFPAPPPDPRPVPPPSPTSARRDRIHQHLAQWWEQLTLPHRRRAALVAVLATELTLLARFLP